MKKILSWQLVVTLVVVVLLGFFDLPNSIQTKVFPWTPKWVENQKIPLGLDLQGGSQLDYKIDLRKVPENDKAGIVNGVQSVIEKRVNALGVSEPSIYLSKFGDEQHIIVELAAVKDLEEAKNTVGKTIQLEFKEKKDAPDAGEKEKQTQYAKDVLAKVTAPNADFGLIGQEEEKQNPGKAVYTKNTDFAFASDLPATVKDAVAKMNPNEISKDLVMVNDEYVYDSQGQLQKSNGAYVLKLLEKGEAVKNKKEVNVEHILISYKDAADKNGIQGVTRTEEEAKKLANDLRSKIKTQADFEKIAKEQSDDAGSKVNGGKLDQPVNDSASYVQEFKDAALKLNAAGDMSEPTKSAFGYHIIRAIDVKSDAKEQQVKLEKIFISLMPDPWKSTELTGEHFVRADVQVNPIGEPYVSINFNEKGAKLFEDITARNVNKPVAIFVGGTRISAPNVKEKISGGTAQISGSFTFDQAKTLARDLNTGAIPAPITLAGQHTIGSTLGLDALQKSTRAGIIGLVLLAIAMILYYRLPGLIAVVALSIYTILLLFLIKSALPIAAALLISLIVFGVLTYKILNNKDPGWEKLISFLLAVVVLIFLTSLLESPITLTLAGVAGVILSIGMAVDANILIFERIKEELGDGHTLSAAIENGFDRAWSSIRDSNFSSLITCTVLFYFGSSMIRGFALNLAAGILISMFSAITLTRTFLRLAARTKFGQNLSLYGVRNRNKAPYKIIEKSKLMLIFSGTLIALSILGTVFFGMKLGLDFTGGTLMSIKFDKSVTTEAIKAELPNIQQQINGTMMTPVATAPVAFGQAAPATTPAIDTSVVVPAAEEKADLSTAQIIARENATFELKTKNLSNAQHETFIKALKSKFGAIEELSYVSVGPTIGDTMKQRALLAILFSSFMIIIFLAFSFRKVPKEVSSWRFGICAVVALLHDLLITFGLFIFLGHFFGVEIDALFITAMLTVLGFSVHDTIVVFDRLREHLNRGEKGSLREISNRSLTETMARSINTSLSTLITLSSLLIFGSSSIFYFILALFVGIVIGTYSSVGVASALLVFWQEKSKN
ncbi:MAG: protein translocase subunit SecF [Candidatus Peregrinibacteria bacterium]|nr:protein translocase subunit SecF [Candidatus Peregrinibacteria bacterium]